MNLQGQKSLLTEKPIRVATYYYDESLELRNARLHRSRTALLASDHLLIVAEGADAE
jgi:hypothetical protein